DSILRCGIPAIDLPMQPAAGGATSTQSSTDHAQRPSRRLISPFSTAAGSTSCRRRSATVSTSSAISSFTTALQSDGTSAGPIACVLSDHRHNVCYVMANLETRVARIAQATLADQRFVRPIDILVGLGWLAQPNGHRWGGGGRAPRQLGAP